MSRLKKLRRKAYSHKPTEEIFTEIYEQNYWEDKESHSGPGSNQEQTDSLIRDLPEIFKQLNIDSIMDAPCGDHYWMKDMPFGSIVYYGVDIVKPLIEKNNTRYGDETRSFHHLDMIQDKLPKADLIFCRDLMVHLSFEENLNIIRNFKRSGAKYLMATDFPSLNKNIDIVAGDWRVLDLSQEPFSFPSPIYSYSEGSSLGNGKFPTKYLNVWELAKINI